MDIRPARREDVPELLDIYNYEVINGVATLDLNTRTLEEWEKWYDAHNGAHNRDNHPLIVGVEDGEITGYASLSEYRQKEAYKTTVELSIYVSPNHRKKGVGRALMAHILEISYSRNSEE